MSPFNLEDYEPVEDRLRAFWKDHPMGRIATELVTELKGTIADGYIVKASIWRGFEVKSERPGEVPPPGATGWAQETVTPRGVNATSALENCETSAIGRALANLGYAPKGKRPSREEMASASSSPARSHPEPRSGRDGDAERGAGEAADGEAVSEPAPQSTPAESSEKSDLSSHPGKPHRMRVAPDFPNYELCTVGLCRFWNYVGKEEEVKA